MWLGWILHSWAVSHLIGLMVPAARLGYWVLSKAFWNFTSSSPCYYPSGTRPFG